MFLNFNTTDNAVSNLDAGISASTTTITLTFGSGVVFPTTNAILTLVQYNTPADPTSGVLKSEKILMTSRSGDILTVTRGYDGSTGTTFLSGDYIYLNVTSKVIEDIQDEVVRLEADKLDDGTLRTGLTANRIIITGGTGDEGYLTPVANRVVSFDGSGNPTTSVPTVDISALTEATSVASTDYYIIYDGSTNKKVKRSNAEESQIVTNGTPSTVTVSASHAGGSDPTVTAYSSAVNISKLSIINVKSILATGSTTTTVEYSTDGGSYSTLYTLSGIGTFIPEWFISKKGYYRLKIVQPSLGDPSASLTALV